MVLNLAYSPCPNDTFAFHAMVNSLVETEELSFYERLLDVQSLNEAAQYATYDICKLSYHAYFRVEDKYQMLGVGSALGYGNGPILVVKDVGKWNRMISGKLAEGEKIVVALPGQWTTAALLFDIFYSDFSDKIIKVYELFSDISFDIMDSSVDAGVLIHEGRFVYKEKGLSLIADLGELWRVKFDLPLPLGLIAIRKEMNWVLKEKIERVLTRSIEFALEYPEYSKKYISENAQELSTDVQKKHVALFVNRYSLDLGEDGRRAIDTLRECFMKLHKKY